MAVRVEIKARHLIKPAEKTWTGTMKLSELDMTFVNFFGRSLYIYNNDDNNNKMKVAKTDILKASLAKVLVHFYPFTGRLRPAATGGAGRIELQVDDDLASGVSFVEAEADADVADLGDDLMQADVQGRLLNLFCSKHDPHKALEEWPLMMVQITHFRCGGVAVAFTLSHVIVDGTAVGHFFAEWTRGINKARENEDKKVTTLAMTIDIRKCVKPPLPQKFGGNAAILNVVVSGYEDLISKPLAYACNHIKKSLNKITDDAIWGYLDYLKSVKDLGVTLGVMTPEGILVKPDVIMVYRLSLPLKNIDFGWGNKAYMTFAVQKMEGRVIVQPDDEDGSAIVIICLQVTHMEKFKHHFFRELA